MGYINSNSSLTALSNSLMQAFNQPYATQGTTYPSTYFASNDPSFKLTSPPMYDQQGYLFSPIPQNNPALQSFNFYPTYINPDISQFDFSTNGNLVDAFKKDFVNFSQTSYKAVGDYQLPQYQQQHGYDPFQLQIFGNNETAQSFLNTSNKIISAIFGPPL